MDFLQPDETLVEPEVERNPSVEEPESEGASTIIMSVLSSLATNVSILPKKGRPFFATPALHWPSALEAWGAAWPLHTYLSAFGFGAMFIWALVHVIRTLMANNMAGKPYYLALNLVMVISMPGRCTRYLIDPYSTNKVFSRLTRTSIGLWFFPSITAAFILVFCTLMRVTRMQVASPRLFDPRLIVFIVLLNYGIAMTTDLLAAIYANLTVMLLVCESYFVMWGIVASSGYFVVFYRLYIGTVVNRRKLNQTGEKGGEGAKKEDLTTKLPTAAKITLVAAFSFIMISLLHIWRLSTAVVYWFNEWPRANHWQWFMYNTLLRISELLMCGTVLYIGSLPFFAPKKK